MISSEVQRTLVKSPPELWAELSNPDSLARHLGELGEIKITRSEPEKLVEWEAAGMTGTVAIKPSGWGTRVTLTVERELPEATAPEGDPGAEVRDGTEAEAGAAGEAEEAPAAQETEQSADPESPPSPAGEIRPEEPRPAPATEAARRAAGWPGPDGTGPAIESVLRAAEDGAQEVAPVSAAWPSVPSDAQEAEPTAVASIPDSRVEPEPRRGFFARLFGGRRRRTAEPTHTEAPPAAAAPSDEELRPASSETMPEPRPDYLPASPEEALPVIVVAEHEPPIAEAEEGEVVETVATPSDDSRAAEPQPEAEAAEDVVEATESKAEAPEAEAGEEPAPARPSAKDIAAELKAAEESAAAEVTAILTGVLDRLGAAHHRPFSRA